MLDTFLVKYQLNTMKHRYGIIFHVFYSVKSLIYLVHSVHGTGPGYTPFDMLSFPPGKRTIRPPGCRPTF